MGKLFLIMGKSATGKDHIFRAVTERLGDDVIKPVVSYTTRPQRESEADGVEYHFVDVERMDELEKNGKIIEKRCYHTVFGDWFYFNCDDGQIDISSNGKSSIIIVTPDALDGFRKYYGPEQLRPIYIEVDDVQRLQRALKRESKQAKPSCSELCRRYLADEEDFAEERLKKQGITGRFINDDFETCVDEVVNYIKSELAAVSEDDGKQVVTGNGR